MKKYYLETSALVKRYKRETGSKFINKLFSDNAELFYLNLSVIEVSKVFYRLHRWPQSIEEDVKISRNDFLALQAQFASDLLLMNRIELNNDIIEKTLGIIERIWIPSVVDLIHLAAFLMVKEFYPELIFVCSDKRSKLLEAAKTFIPKSKVIIPEEKS